MTRVKSITDLSKLYESMYNVTESNEILEEKKSGKKFPKGTFQKAGEETKEPKTFKSSGPNAVRGLKKTKKNKKKGGKMYKENINSSMKSKFDKLFENVMDDEMDVNMDLGPSAGPEDAGVEDLDLDTDTDTDMGGDEVTLTMDRETAQKLYDMIGDVLGGEEDEMPGEEESDLEDLEIDTDETEDSEEEDEQSYGMRVRGTRPGDEDEQEEVEDEDEEEEEMKEGIESEKLPDSAGHKLTKGMEAAGNVKARTGKASSDVTDEVGSSNLGDKGHHLMSKGSNKVGNLKQGQDLFKK